MILVFIGDCSGTASNWLLFSAGAIALAGEHAFLSWYQISDEMSSKNVEGNKEWILWNVFANAKHIDHALS